MQKILMQQVFVSFLYAYKKNRGISNLSLNNKRSAISSFFSWLVDEEYIDKDPTRKIKKIKVTKKKKKAFTADEMERMRIACTDIRDRALIEMLACTGCRVSELSNISLNDVDFLRKKVRIVGKGDKRENGIYFRYCYDLSQQILRNKAR